MTTIAWDGKTLAADRGTWLGAIVVQCDKIRVFHEPVRHLPAGAWADCGDSAYSEAVCQWLLGKTEERPRPTDEKAHSSIGLWITMDGIPGFLHANLVLEQLPKQIVAEGRGAAFAYGAMLAGASAAAALDLANKYTDCAAHGFDTWSPGLIL